MPPLRKITQIQSLVLCTLTFVHIFLYYAVSSTQILKITFTKAITLLKIKRIFLLKEILLVEVRKIYKHPDVNTYTHILQKKKKIEQTESKD